MGAALGIAYVYAVRDSVFVASQYAYSALIFGGIGAGVGLGIDALLDRSARAVVIPHDAWHSAPRYRGLPLGFASLPAGNHRPESFA